MASLLCCVCLSFTVPYPNIKEPTGNSLVVLPAGKYIHYTLVLIFAAIELM